MPSFRRQVVAIAFAGSLVGLVACQTKVNNPVQPGYPCGTLGLVCSNHMCCWRGDVCGGDDPTCPANYCCWVGNDDPTMLGVKQPRIRPQSKPIARN